MRQMCIPLVIAAALLATGLVAAGDADKESKQFQGTWEVLFIEAGGTKAAAGKINPGGIRIVIAGDKFKFLYPKEKEGDWDLTFKLDPAKKPKQIDLTNLNGPFKGQPVLGIYAWEGTSLKLCFPDDPENDKTRPKAFGTAKGSTLKVYYLKKAAK